MHTLTLHCDAANFSDPPLRCRRTFVLSDATSKMTQKQIRDGAAKDGWTLVTRRDGSRFDVCPLHDPQTHRIYAEAIRPWIER